jgi:hypothetical protein
MTAWSQEVFLELSMQAKMHQRLDRIMPEQDRPQPPVLQNAPAALQQPSASAMQAPVHSLRKEVKDIGFM